MRLRSSIALAGISGLLALNVWMQMPGNRQQSGTGSSAAQKDQKDYRFTSGQSALRIPFEENDGHIFLQVRINDSAPLWFGLDTGAIRSIIDTRRAQSLGLRSEGTQQVGGAGGTEEAAIIKGTSIKLPGAELHNQTIWALPLEAISVANGREMAGIIGYELFSHFVVEIDYAALYINLYEPQTYKYRGRGESIPLGLQDGEIYIPAKVTVPGRETLEGQFVVDTGGNGSLLLAKSFVDEHKLLASVGPTIPAGGGGVGGAIQMDLGRVKSLQVGGFVFDNPLTGFIKVGQIAEPGKAGNIGGRLLRRFRVTFDYSRRQMMLEPNAHFPETDEADMSGAALMSEPPTFKVIKVIRVRPDSPAARAGLKQHDVIIAVDRQPAASLTINNLRKMFRVDGREYLLRVKRGEETLEIRIKLKRLI